MIRAGIGIPRAFRDKFQIPDGPGLYTLQPDMFVAIMKAPGSSQHLPASKRTVFFEETQDEK